MKIISIIFAAVVALSSVVSAAADLPANEQRSKKVYRFQHQLLPRLAVQSGERFFAELVTGDITRLRAAARQLVDDRFADALIVQGIDEQRFLFTFEVPDATPNCYYAVIEKTETGYRYFTLELALDVSNSGLKCVIGEWPEPNTHRPLGYVKYTDAGSFVDSLNRRRALASTK